MMRYVPPPPTAPQIVTASNPAGFLGTQRTLGHIKRHIQEGASDFYVRQKAIDILLARGIKAKDYLGEIRALFEWVQGNVRYTKDPLRVEVIHSARRMLELRAGDCDDMTVLLGSMLQAIGHPVRLIIVGPDPQRPRLFSHIYLEASYQGRWIPLDATMPHPMGWSPWAPVRTVIDLGRRTEMSVGDAEIQQIGEELAAPVPIWLPGLLASIRQGGLRPKDPRVRSLWLLLRQRGLLARSPFVQRALRFAWNRGLSARPRPRTAARLRFLLGRWGILPPFAGAALAPSNINVNVTTPMWARARHRYPMRPVRPVYRPTTPAYARPSTRYAYGARR
jgi:hypothetical protein